MGLEKLVGKELRKRLVRHLGKESIGGNAGPERAAANTIVDSYGNILGFSNDPEDYKGYQQATIIFYYGYLGERIRKEAKLPRWIVKIKRFFGYKLPYIDRVLYEGDNKEEIVQKIEEQLKRAGYRKLKYNEKIRKREEMIMKMMIEESKKFKTLFS